MPCFHRVVNLRPLFVNIVCGRDARVVTAWSLIQWRCECVSGFREEALHHQPGFLRTHFCKLPREQHSVLRLNLKRPARPCSLPESLHELPHCGFGLEVPNNLRELQDRDCPPRGARAFGAAPAARS